jgi:hypothetical protein
MGIFIRVNSIRCVNGEAACAAAVEETRKWLARRLRAAFLDTDSQEHAKSRRLQERTTMSRRTKLIHEGRRAAEIPVDLIEDESGWSPYLLVEDALKLDAVRDALRRREVAVAARHGRIFELVPVMG